MARESAPLLARVEVGLRLTFVDINCIHQSEARVTYPGGRISVGSYPKVLTLGRLVRFT